MAYFIILGIIVIFILLLILDFKMGQKHHQRNPRTLPFKTTHADYKLYKNGSPLYEDLFQDISEAKKHVDVYFFLIENDYLSQNFLQVLKDKAEEGVPVRLLADRVASFKINKKIRMELNEAGVEFAFAEKPGFPFFFYRLHRRNHRKITVIDGKTAYMGGFNIGRAYVGETAQFRDWRDYHMRLTGPVVEELHRVMLDDWYLATRQELSPVEIDTVSGEEVRVIATDGMGLEDEFIKMIESADQEIRIGTPYFIPTKRIQDALKDALGRGVALYIMIPAKRDHTLVKEAGVPYLADLFRHGAHVGFFDAGFYHAKVVLIDQKLADIGTANFDRRSLFLNKEVNLFIFEESFIGDLIGMYMEDFEKTITLDEEWMKKRPLKMRINEKIASWVRPFL